MRIRRGQHFARLGVDGFEVDGTDAAQVEQLLREVRGSELQPFQALFFRPLSQPGSWAGGGETFSADLEQELSRGIRPLALLCGEMLRAPQIHAPPGLVRSFVQPADLRGVTSSARPWSTLLERSDVRCRRWH